jgi:hypothetical protein
LFSPDTDCATLHPLKLGQLSVPPFPHTNRVSSVFYPKPTGRYEIFPPFICTQVFSVEEETCSPATFSGLSGSLQRSWYVSPTCQGCLLTQLWDGRGRQHRQVPCPWNMVYPGHPRCLQDSCSSQHCDFACLSSKTGETKIQKKKRKMEK